MMKWHSMHHDFVNLTFLNRAIAHKFIDLNRTYNGLYHYCKRATSVSSTKHEFSLNCSNFLAYCLKIDENFDSHYFATRRIRLLKNRWQQKLNSHIPPSQNGHKTDDTRNSSQLGQTIGRLWPAHSTTHTHTEQSAQNAINQIYSCSRFSQENDPKATKKAHQN